MKSFLRKVLPDNFFLRRWFSAIKAVIAALVYGFPGHKLFVIGVTGTDGKTTTSEMIFHILNKSGIKAAKISSASFSIGDKTYDNKTKRTTVAPLILQKFLKQCLKEKVEVVVVEVSSHALAQHRVFGIDFNIAVLTNVTHEHLDYHLNIENLRVAKKRLFTKYLSKGGVSIINADDPVIKEWKKDIKNMKTYSMKDKHVDLSLVDFHETDEGINFEIKNVKFSAKVFGLFNGENALAAILTCLNIPKKLGLEDIAKAFKDFSGVPGRLENLDFGQNFQIFVDFALTPGAFEKVLKYLKSRTKGKLIAVFGAAGDHDKTKRPQMGFLAKQNADTIILTNDETYTEDEEEIRKDIKKGIFLTTEEREIALQDRSFYEIPNRQQAIHTALQIAQPRDTIIISGMGCLESCNLGGKEVPWSDKKIIKDAFQQLYPDKSKSKLKLLQGEVSKKK